ncbi:hypothetical protein MD484_g617, partial [Candolleomyces efflorescens]
MSGKQTEYIPNSRQPEVDELCKLESSGNELVLCIYGPAGIGKSTLAAHLSDELRSSGRLAASIFLGAFPTDSCGPATIIKMIAHEIGSIHPGAISTIVEAMERCHGTSLETHLQHYILEPLQSLGSPRPFVVIVDAMDEWKDSPAFLEALASLNPYGRVVKFIVTDRLNPCILHAKGVENVTIRTYALGPISNEVIKSYFRKSLATVPWVEGRMAHPADVDKLTELSGGLPIWASTVIKLLSHRFDDSPPHEILEEIVESRRQVGGSGNELGELYRAVLLRLFPTSDSKKQFQRFMGAVVALQEPLSPSDFSAITGIPVHLISQIQFALSAIQTRPPPPGSETMIHPASALVHLSFLEYVQASTTDTSLAISTFDSHSLLGLKCLEQLVQIPPSSSISRLRGHQRYAVKYWLLHLSKGTPRAKGQWSQTQHCSILGSLSPVMQRQWGNMFLQSLKLGDMVSTMGSFDTKNGIPSILSVLAYVLRISGDDYWGYQIACLEVAVRIVDDDATTWRRLGCCYDTRGRRTDSLQMHEEALAAFRHALQLRPQMHPERAESLRDVGYALYCCCEQNGNLAMLSEAASLYREALDLCPTPHPHRWQALTNLASILHFFHDRSSDMVMLNEMVSLRREALELCPAPHPDRSSSLNNLANALLSLYKRNGDISALNEAIPIFREAIGLCPALHPDRPSFLSNLAVALLFLHECDREVSKLDEAVSLLRTAPGLSPVFHSARIRSLNSLAFALQSLYESNGDITALKEAISLFRERLQFRPASHPYRSDSLNNLAWALHSLYLCDGNVKQLTEAVSLYREALSLRRVSHPARRTQSLQNLANALLLKFDQSGEMEVLDEAVSLRSELLILNPPGCRHRLHAVHALWQVLVMRRKVTGDDRDSKEIDGLVAELEVFKQKIKAQTKR